MSLSGYRPTPLPPPELAGFLLACTVVALLQQTMAHRYLLVFLLVS
jgi:hypothetical protein